MQLRWLATLSWPEFKQHPWRSLTAIFAITLGVALALAVHLINASALAEFGQAMRTAQAQADLVLTARQGALPETLMARLVQHPDVQVANPVLEATVSMAHGAGPAQKVRVLGVDSLAVAQVAPELLPQRTPRANADAADDTAGDSDQTGATDGTDAANASQDNGRGWLDWFATDAVYLNAGARTVLALPANATHVALINPTGGAPMALRIVGSVAAPGAPLAVMDIAAAQQALGRPGQLTRIDIKLHRTLTPDKAMRAFDLPNSVLLSRPDDASARTAQLSRAYRVNLSVMALVALFTGAFLVYSVLALSVAQRAPQLALLGVLGFSPPERLRLVLIESALLGVVGSALGLALGTALAWGAMRVLGGDLGGGYFSAQVPPLQWSGGAALAYGGLGVLAAVLGGWLPARTAATLPPAQTLKGAGVADAKPLPIGLGLGLLAFAGLLAMAPSVAGVPVAAYASVGVLLLGGMALLPHGVALVYNRLAPWVSHMALPLLAVERARRLRALAAVAVSGVVAALALATALTVMVASFRQSMLTWLDAMLPADVYLHMPQDPNSAGLAALPEQLQPALRALPAVARVSIQRSESWSMDPRAPAVAVIWRELHPQDTSGSPSAAANLPLTATASPVPAGARAVYVSEQVRDQMGLRQGQAWPALAQHLGATPNTPFVVAGIYRDYARPSGSVTLDWSELRARVPQPLPTEAAIWLAPQVEPTAGLAQIQAAAEAFASGSASAPDSASARALTAPEVHSTQSLRSRSMQIFDRSFAVTYWLQAIAIGIGLFGVSASFSAQALARRKEFGLLVHLGLTRGQIRQLVAFEGMAWCTIGALAGIGLGLGAALVLIRVVNPQSFHWSMDAHIPWLRLAALGAAVIVAGTVTAYVTARRIAAQDAVRAVKEDW